MTSPARSAVCIVALVAAGGALSARQQPDTGWTPVLEVRAISSTPQGSTANASGTWKILKDGEPLAMSFWSGATLCTLGTARGTQLSPETNGARRNIWTLSGDYAGERAGRQQIRVTSKFVRLGGRDASAETTQLLSLRSGDEVTLDAMTEAIEGTCNVHAVTLEARLLMQPADPELARAAYSADLWLVHDGPATAQMRERLLVNVDGTTAMPFLFRQLTFALPQLDPRQGSLAAAISLAGSLRARTRLDGQVDLDIETNRVMYGFTTSQRLPFAATVARQGVLESETSRARYGFMALQPFASTVGKTVTVKPGETTAIDFPPPASGFASLRLEPSNAGDQVRVEAGRARFQPPASESSSPAAVEVRGDNLVLNTAAFFKGHKTQLLITLKPLR